MYGINVHLSNPFSLGRIFAKFNISVFSIVLKKLVSNEVSGIAITNDGESIATLNKQHLIKFL